jgi:hypothetical protein
VNTFLQTVSADAFDSLRSAPLRITASQRKIFRCLAAMSCSIGSFSFEAQCSRFHLS